MQYIKINHLNYEYYYVIYKLSDSDNYIIIYLDENLPVSNNFDIKKELSKNELINIDIFSDDLIQEFDYNRRKIITVNIIIINHNG